MLIISGSHVKWRSNSSVPVSWTFITCSRALVLPEDLFNGIIEHFPFQWVCKVQLIFQLLVNMPFALQICYFFYKNITFGVTLFLYEAYTSFSGQPAYNDWFMSCYNVFFTSLPVIALGVFDQDVSARFCLKVCI